MLRGSVTNSWDVIEFLEGEDGLRIQRITTTIMIKSQTADKN